MDTVPALLTALDVQVALARRIGPAELSLPSPCPGWSVGDVLGHSVGVTRKFTCFAAGETDHPRSPAGRPLGADHRVAVAAAAAGARAAWAGADLARLCHLPFGTVPALGAAGINLVDVLAHTWDCATGTGHPLRVGDRLGQAALDAAQAMIGPDRDPAHYGPAVPSPPGAGAMVRFLHLLGRPG